jgi:hypothetical protein
MAESFHDASASADRLLPDGRQLPEDFDDQDVAVARLLNGHFDPASEHLPPRYVQTLLGPSQFAPASDDLEERIAGQVFGRLGIDRPSYVPVVRRRVRRGPYRASSHQKRRSRGLRQPALALLALLVLIVGTSLASGAAFASMIHLISGRSGAKMVSHYPTLSHLPTSSSKSDVGKLTVEFLPQWAGKTIDGYAFVGMDIYKSQWWTQGALVMLHYQMQDSTGLHQFAMLEFKPSMQVALQVVQDGFASDVALGSSSGVFVSGQWTMQDHQTVWTPGTRAELICHSPQNPNVVIWLAVENASPSQQDANKDLLLSAAGALTGISLDETTTAPLSLSYVSSDLMNASVQPFTGDVVALSPGDGGQGNTSLYIQINLDAPGHTAVLKNEGMNSSQ